MSKENMPVEQKHMLDEVIIFNNEIEKIRDDDEKNIKKMAYKKFFERLFPSEEAKLQAVYELKKQKADFDFKEKALSIHREQQLAAFKEFGNSITAHLGAQLKLKFAKMFTTLQEDLDLFLREKGLDFSKKMVEHLEKIKEIKNDKLREALEKDYDLAVKNFFEGLERRREDFENKIKEYHG